MKRNRPLGSYRQKTLKINGKPFKRIQGESRDQYIKRWRRAGGE